jgi:hypothetical protein
MIKTKSNMKYIKPTLFILAALLLTISLSAQQLGTRN